MILFSLSFFTEITSATNFTVANKLSLIFSYFSSDDSFTPIKVNSDLKELVNNKPNVVIDFSTPESTMRMLKHCANNKIGVVIGTTGFKDNQLNIMRHYSEKIPILLSANMSLGVNKLFSLVTETCKILGNGYDVEILEAHHKHKIDAPSGTALHLGKIVAENMGFPDPVKTSFCFSRANRQSSRKNNEIGFSSIRGGDIVGKHALLFIANGETLEITHTSSSRASYATGALAAAQFVSKQKKGFYEMKDAIGN